MNKVLVLILFLLLLFPAPVLARIGVGVATGKIQVEEQLKPGMMYTLPSLTVLNTGDEPADYEVAITYQEGQKENKPLEEWFTFSPKEFRLEPGKAQPVEIRLNVPIKTVPGDYFAYLEGHPAQTSESGSTRIGVAAASKLYFTIAPANFIQGVYYRVVSFWSTYAPWTSIVGGVVAVGLVGRFLCKFVNIEINVGKKHWGSGKDEPKSSVKDEEDDNE